MTGLFMGIGESFNAPIERSPADIMVLGPTADALFGGGAGLPRRIGPQLYMYPGVAQVEDLELNFAIWQNDPNGGATGKKPKKVSSQQNGLNHLRHRQCARIGDHADGLRTRPRAPPSTSPTPSRSTKLRSTSSA